MREILADAERWQARGGAVCALATVVATRRWLRARSARSWRSRTAARWPARSRADASRTTCTSTEAGARRSTPQLVTYGISGELALSVGLPCGGEIDVFVEEADPRLSARIRGLLERDERAVLFTVVEGEGVGTPRRSRPTRGRRSRRGRSHLTEEGRSSRTCSATPRLLVIGAVDTAKESVRLGQAARLAQTSPTRAASSPRPSGSRAPTS